MHSRKLCPIMYKLLLTDFSLAKSLLQLPTVVEILQFAALLLHALL